MALYALDGLAPRLADETVWIADGAHVIGNVFLGRDVSIWFGCTLRGDNEPITIGERTNIQENAVLHTDPGFPMTIGAGCTIGHKAMLHGCTIGDGALIGMSATVLNGAVIGRNCLVGAGALVTEGKTFPNNSLVLGSPAKVVRTLTEEEIADMRQTSNHYVENARRFAAGLTRLD